MHPPVLVLLLIAGVSAAALAASGMFAVGLLRHWNPQLGSARQIELERRTQLVATVVAQILVLQGLALLVMVYNADRTAPLLVGAMCAFGSFKASVYGFPALGTKLALFFASGVWLALHRADLQARDYPLTRRKYAMLLVGVLPFALADAGLSLAYFADLQPDTLTSCCGSAFQPERPGLAAEIAALDPRGALMGLGLSLALVVAWGLRARRHAAWAVGYGVASGGFFILALMAVVAAVSVYVYESPHHHCPFCILKREYGYFGFALYLPLFVGTSAGLASGALSLRVPASLQRDMPRHAGRLRRVSMLGFLLFGLLCASAVLQSGLRL